MKNIIVCDTFAQLRFVKPILDENYVVQHELNGFEITFRKLLFVQKAINPYDYEINIVKDNLKVIMWLSTCGWCNIRDIRIFGLVNYGEVFYQSVVLSKDFDKHLFIAKNILQFMFHRIEYVKRNDDNPSQSSKNFFLEDVQQLMNHKMHSVIVYYTRLRQVVRRFQKKHLCKRILRLWVEHYYSPDTCNGFMDNRIKTYAHN